MKLISKKEAASLIQDNWCIVTGGFGSCGHPDTLTQTLRNRYLETKSPTNLRLFFAAGSGDKQGKGLDALAIPGLVIHAIGGFWGLCPELIEMARRGELEAHNWPQGIISKLFSSIAAGSPGLFSKVGLNTFIDPNMEGGVIETGQYKSLVERISIKGSDYLFYPAQQINCALLRGTSSDKNGNISFGEETSYMDALAQAIAAKNSGGIVIVQIKNVIENHEMALPQVKIPSFLVDYIVIADEDNHPQTYGNAFEPAYTCRTALSAQKEKQVFNLAKQIIADRAALELQEHRGSNINLGIGIPALIGASAKKMGFSNFTLSVESGLIGGIPDEGLSFGASINPQAIIEQAALFDFYDGGGLDVAFLGFGEVDSKGNVNVSKLGDKFPGSGGFINISQSAKKVVFCGTLTTKGLEVAINNSRLEIVREGSIKKFVNHVSHLTFNGKDAQANNQKIMFITERCVFILDHDELVLTEIFPGISVADLEKVINFKFKIHPELKVMKITIDLEKSVKDIEHSIIF